MQSEMFGFMRMLRTFAVHDGELIRNIEPSQRYQTGLIDGLPCFRHVARIALRRVAKKWGIWARPNAPGADKSEPALSDSTKSPTSSSGLDSVPSTPMSARPPRCVIASFVTGNHVGSARA